MPPNKKESTTKPIIQHDQVNEAADISSEAATDEMSSVASLVAFNITSIQEIAAAAFVKHQEQERIERNEKENKLIKSELIELRIKYKESEQHSLAVSEELRRTEKILHSQIKALKDEIETVKADAETRIKTAEEAIKQQDSEDQTGNRLRNEFTTRIQKQVGDVDEVERERNELLKRVGELEASTSKHEVLMIAERVKWQEKIEIQRTIVLEEVQAGMYEAIEEAAIAEVKQNQDELKKEHAEMSYEIKLQNSKINQLYKENKKILRINKNLKRELILERDTAQMIASKRERSDARAGAENVKSHLEMGKNERHIGMENTGLCHVRASNNSPVPPQAARQSGHQIQRRLHARSKAAVIAQQEQRAAIKASKTMNAEAVEAKTADGSTRDLDGNGLLQLVDLGKGLGKMLVPTIRRPGARADATMTKFRRKDGHKGVNNTQDDSLFNFVL